MIISREDIKGILIYMGMAVNSVMWPESLYESSLPYPKDLTY